MRFRRQPATDKHVADASAPAVEAHEPAAFPPLELTHAELERLIRESGDARPGRAADWRWYADYLRDRVDADGRIPAEYRLLVRIVYADLPGLPELDAAPSL
jgi:hypothetical protein